MLSMRVNRLLYFARRKILMSAGDLTTPAGRGMERYRRIGLTIVSSGLAKCLSLASILITVPLTVHYLGAERYGMWMTITSLVAVLSFADLGLGNGLLNAITVANARSDRHAGQVAVSSAFLMLLGATVLLTLAFVLAFPHVDWGKVFNVQSPLAYAEAPAAVAAFMVCFLINLPLSVVQRVQAGFQEGFASNLWQALGSLLGLLFVCTAVRCELGLPWLVLSLSGGPLLAAALNCLFHFGRTRPWLAPSLRAFRWSEARHLMRGGVYFVVLNVATLLGIQSDTFIVAHFCGAGAVATYTVASRLFWFTILISTLALPTWPAIGEAIERGDVEWAAKLLKRLLIFSCCGSTLLGFGAVLYGQRLSRLWVGTLVVPQVGLLAALAVWSLICGYNSSVMMLLNSNITLARHALLFGVTSCISLALKIPLVAIFGISGVVLASSLAFGAIYVPLSMRLARRALDVSRGALRGSVTDGGVLDAVALDTV